MKHTQECNERQFKHLTDVAKFEAAHPKYCKHCNGWGMFFSTYDPSPAGVGLSPGTMTDSNPCPACVDNNLCPLCASELTGEWGEEDNLMRCSNPECNWNELVEDGLPEAPECLCWEEQQEDLEDPGAALDKSLDLFSEEDDEDTTESGQDDDKYEIQRVLTCSTAHVPSADHLKRVSESDILVSWDYEYGTLIQTPYIFGGENDEEVQHLRDTVGNEITDILKFAHEELKCWAVRFDCDGETYDRFPTFEW